MDSMAVSSPLMPDIASLSVIMSQNKVLSEFNTAMLSKSLDTFESSGADLTKMMELSVQPGLGANFDMSV